MKYSAVKNIVATIESVMSDIASVRVQDASNYEHTLEEYESEHENINARNLLVLFNARAHVTQKRFSVFSSFVRFNQAYESACEYLTCEKKRERDNFYVARLSDTQTLGRVLFELQCAQFKRLANAHAFDFEDIALDANESAQVRNAFESASTSASANESASASA